MWMVPRPVQRWSRPGRSGANGPVAGVGSEGEHTVPNTTLIGQSKVCRSFRKEDSASGWRKWNPSLPGRKPRRRPTITGWLSSGRSSGPASATGRPRPRQCRYDPPRNPAAVQAPHQQARQARSGLRGGSGGCGMSSLCSYHARRRATHTAVVVDVDNSLPGETAYRRIPVCEECAAYLGEHSASKVEPLGSFQAPRRALLVPKTAFCATSDSWYFRRPLPPLSH